MCKIGKYQGNTQDPIGHPNTGHDQCATIFRDSVCECMLDAADGVEWAHAEVMMRESMHACWRGEGVNKEWASPSEKDARQIADGSWCAQVHVRAGEGRVGRRGRA